jgi:HEAT repeat protein
VRKAALYAAMSSAGEASAPALGQMLEGQQDPEQRKAIVYALSDIDSDESVAILARVAKNDQDKQVRHAAVQALGAIGTPAAKQALRDLLGER